MNNMGNREVDEREWEEFQKFVADYNEQKRRRKEFFQKVLNVFKINKTKK